MKSLGRLNPREPPPAPLEVTTASQVHLTSSDTSSGVFRLSHTYHTCTPAIAIRSPSRTTPKETPFSSACPGRPALSTPSQAAPYPASGRTRPKEHPLFLTTWPYAFSSALSSDPTGSITPSSYLHIPKALARSPGS